MAEKEKGIFETILGIFTKIFLLPVQLIGKAAESANKLRKK
jgi:hypothetical protein